MTTIINNPDNGESTGMGFVIGVIFVVVVLLGVFYMYGLPYIKNRSAPAPSNGVKLEITSPNTQGN